MLVNQTKLYMEAFQAVPLLMGPLLGLLGSVILRCAGGIPEARCLSRLIAASIWHCRTASHSSSQEAEPFVSSHTLFIPLSCSCRFRPCQYSCLYPFLQMFCPACLPVSALAAVVHVGSLPFLVLFVVSFFARS